MVNRKVSDLNKYVHNPRKITSSQARILAKGLTKYGDLGGVVFNVRNQQLVGGNQRTDVFHSSDEVTITEKFEQPDAQGTVALGYILHDGAKYSYREVDWDEEDHQAACLLANKAGGDWDWAKVKELGQSLESANYDMDFTGFDAVEWENLLAPVMNSPQSSDEDRAESMDERAERYGQQGLSKIEVWIEDEEYDRFIDKLNELKEKMNLDNYSDVFRTLVYENNRD